MKRDRGLTLDDIDISPANGPTSAAPELANLLSHGGPLAIAKRLVDLAERAEPSTKAALLELAHQMEPGPISRRLAARCRIEVNRQPDHSAPADDDPGAGVWGPDMATYIGDRWLRRQLGELGHAS